MMWRREELLKSIWHAFTALDVDRSGKVSKSQLKVLSHNLYTVMKIPHDPVALEEHFKDNNEGPVSNQGYMPYLKEFILDKAQDNFDVLEFNTMCWTLCYKKYINVSPLLISNDDAFKVWCIFNFLSEDTYPLIIVTEEMEYFLQKLMETMGSSWNKEKSEEFKLQLNGKNSLSTWELIQLVGMGYFSKGLNRQTLSMGIGEVFQELILDVLKQGYLMKKGHGRKNWTERWFVLRPNAVSYFTSEALGDKKGEIALSRDCSVESLPDKEGRKCLFIIKCTDKSFEISAPDKKKKHEWIQAIQACVQQLRLGLLSSHREARLRRRELRQRQHSQHEEITERMNQLLAANERKQMQLEFMRKKLDEASAKAATEEQRRKQTQADLQDRFTLDLEKEKMAREQMEQLVAQKSSEVEQYLQRVRELEELYHSLEEALENERQAKQDEEAMHQLQSRLLEEEVGKRAELELLELLHLQQQRTISQATAEKQELQAEHRAKEEALQAAALQLQSLERERMGALEQYQEVAKRLERAANKTKSWKDKVTKHEGMLRLIQPGDKGPQRVTNWGPASFTDAELEFRKKLWQERKNQNDPSE